MNYEVRPHAGLGPIDLKALREEVRIALGENPREVKRRLLRFPMDFFVNAALQIEYGANSRVISIQATSLASVSFHGRPLIGTPFEELMAWFKKLDPLIKINGAGLTSESLGIGLYAQSALKEPKLPVEAVIVFVPGYYDNTYE